jgi:hypothetical protein
MRPHSRPSPAAAISVLGIGSSKQGGAKREIAQIEANREAYMANPRPPQKCPNRRTPI